MRVAIEGINGIGKTTLALKLYQKLKLPYHKHPKSQRLIAFLQGKHSQLLEAQLDELTHLMKITAGVLDRGYYSHYVYPILHPNIPVAYKTFFMAVIPPPDITILVTGNVEEAVQNCKGRQNIYVGSVELNKKVQEMMLAEHMQTYKNIMQINNGNRTYWIGNKGVDISQIVETINQLSF